MKSFLVNTRFDCFRLTQFDSCVIPRIHLLSFYLMKLVWLQDLSSTRVSRISLALKALIAAPTPEVVPAVRDRIVDLLNHPS